MRKEDLEIGALAWLRCRLSSSHVKQMVLQRFDILGTLIEPLRSLLRQNHLLDLVLRPLRWQWRRKRVLLQARLSQVVLIDSAQSISSA